MDDARSILQPAAEDQSLPTPKDVSYHLHAVSHRYRIDRILCVICDTHRSASDSVYQQMMSGTGPEVPPLFVYRFKSNPPELGGRLLKREDCWDH